MLNAIILSTLTQHTDALDRQAPFTQRKRLPPIRGRTVAIADDTLMPSHQRNASKAWQGSAKKSTSNNHRKLSAARHSSLTWAERLTRVFKWIGQIIACTEDPEIIEQKPPHVDAKSNAPTNHPPTSRAPPQVLAIDQRVIRTLMRSEKIDRPGFYLEPLSDQCRPKAHQKQRTSLAISNDAVENEWPVAIKSYLMTFLKRALKLPILQPRATAWRTQVRSSRQKHA
jgi:hypothetical protein